MCGSGCSPNSRAKTIDSGALMAVIHPSTSLATTTTTPSLFSGATLRLHNPPTASSPTLSTISLHPSRAASPCESVASTTSSSSTASSGVLLSVQIHASNEQSAVLHRFEVDAEDEAMVGVGERMDLGVGGTGIVGRAVSVADARGRILGWGVVGYGW